MVEFNRLLLIACVCIVVASILYFFYWNRFIGFIIGRAIRILFWNQEGSSIWVEIGSIHFSILTGRILLKDVRYHSSNQTLKIVTGKIQWRYWTRRPTSEEELNSGHGEDVKHSVLLSCRVEVSLQGLEWFIYNRTAAYDGIVEQMEKQTRPNSRSSSHHRFFSRFSRQDNRSAFQAPSLIRSAAFVPAPITRAIGWFKQQLPNLDPKDLLPLGINVQTGAIILGNPSTPNLLVAEFQSALGTYSTSPSRSKYDLYKQVLGLKLQNNRIRFVQNDGYVDPMVTLGALVHTGIKNHPTFRKYLAYQTYRSFMKLWRQVGLYQLVLDYFATRRAQRHTDRIATSSLPFRKSKKTIDEDLPIGRDFYTLEYAIERRILEAPVLELTYYADVVGDLPPQSIQSRFGGDGLYNIGNGDTDPEWGFDLIVYGGLLRYGPWTDRQRTELQRAFFPPMYQDSEVTSRLKPGDKRAWTSLQVFIELREETILHVPFRESSKDWQWDGIVEISQSPRKREAATINIAVGDRSSINYVLPMVIGPKGYESTLEVHLDTMTITSSLNDIRLISSESARIRCELPTPLKWDADRTWLIAMYLRQPILFLLRDHINMFTDLGKDWASGPPTDFQKFIPMIYLFQLEIYHFELNLYANDQNIVDKPLVKEENALATLKGPHLKTTVTTPLNKFRAEPTTLKFDVTAPNLALDISLPRWNVHALNMSPRAWNLLSTPSFKLSGSYLYFSEVHEESIEQFKLNFDLSDTRYYAYGWSIRYFMILRDNYIGSFTHFQTLSEYLNKREQKLPVGDPIKLKYRAGKANMLDVTLSLQIVNAQVIQPVNLIGPSNDVRSGKQDLAGKETHHVVLDVPEIQVQLRTHDFYMDMSVNVDTIIGSVRRTCYGSSGESLPTLSEVLVIDGFDITANRLFGPQPRTATYVCIWEIAFGTVKASMSANEAQLLAAAGNSFRLNFVDPLNAPAEEFLPGVDLDVTFYKITTKSVEVTWRAGNATLLLRLSQGLKFDSNDLGSHQYHKVTSLRIPHISGNVLLTRDLGRNSWLEAAEISGDAYVDIYSSPVGHRLATRNQLTFIEEQDKLTNRAKLMFNQLRQRAKVNLYADRMSHTNGVYLPQPTLPIVAPHPSKLPPSQRGPAPRPASSRISTLQNLSDSEGEEWISEVDRDARLARTRTSTPVTQGPDDDVTLSSGDESDDADLTDGESTAEDWSDIDGPPHTHPIASLMSFYSPILKHYMFNWMHNIRSWEGPAYTLTKEGAPFLRFERSENATKATLDPFWLKLSEDIPKNEDTTTIRIRFTQVARAVFNPLLVQAAIYFKEDAQNITLDPALFVDSLLANATNNASAKKVQACMLLDVDLPRASLQTMHHIAMTEDGHPNVTKSMKSAGVPSNLDIMSAITCNLDDLRFGGILGQKSYAVKISLKQIKAVMDMPIDKRSISSGTTATDIVELDISSISLSVAQCVLSAKFDEITIKIGHRGPEFAAATCLAMTSAASTILQLVDAFKVRHKTMERTMLACILKGSEHESIIDPLSTIQPSYLVQSGIPHALRTDASFRFLYHLQNCLWNMKAPTFHLDHSVGPMQIDDLISAIESRLTLLDPDAFSIEHLSSINTMLFPLDKKLQKLTRRFIHKVSVKFVKTTATILDPSGGSSSQLQSQELGIILQSKPSDLIQLNTANSSSASQTSLRTKSPKMAQSLILTVSLGDATLAISPQLTHFAEHVLRIKKQFAFGANDTPLSKKVREISDKPTTSKLYFLETTITVRHFRIQAAAENLILVIGLDGAQSALTALLLHNQKIQSLQQSLFFNKIYLQARSPTDSTKETDSDILAALNFTGGRTNGIYRGEYGSRKNLKLVLGLESMRLHVPRSALRLFHFVGQWRADYLPGIEAALKAVVSEYNTRPIKPLSPTPSRQSRRSSSIQIHGLINHFEISLQVMHGTWLSWEFHKTIAYMQSSGHLMATPAHAFGLQVASMVLNVSSASNAKEMPTGSRIKMMLPPFSLSGSSDGQAVHTLVLLDFIELKVKPSHWDTLLAVQQKFGQDFNDLMALIQKTRSEGQTFTKPSTSRQFSMQYDGHLKMRGFRIGLEGISSTVLLECQDINGGISNVNGWSWDLGLSDLALFLAPRISSRQRSVFNRNHRSAFVIIDFNFRGFASDVSSDKSLQLSVTKIHAVMQPSSIGEFGDFIDNLQVELLERQEQRAFELAAFKEKTQRILRTFDANIGETQVEKTAWINDLMINVLINNVGVAFPLTHDEDLGLLQNRSKGSASTRAFLFSIKSIKFETHRGETGQARMQHLSFQFISSFTQSSPEDFGAENHHTRNWLLYPEMKAQLRSSSSASSRKFWIKADVSGFILDIDSTISNYIFALIDVYRQGKERVERLSANAPRTPLTSIPTIEAAKPSIEKRHDTTPTANIFSQLVFHSGKVRLYSRSARQSFETSIFASSNSLEIPDEQILALGAEVFNLPIVSVRGEYRATAAPQRRLKDAEIEPSVLMFNSTVFSSQNTLRPSLLPFLTELIHHIELRMRKASPLAVQSPPLLSHPSTSSMPPKDDDMGPVSTMQITFSLRIDKSKLELTCQPDVNVVAGLHWESGGFVVNVSPGARKVTFFGSVGGLTIGLKHGFLSDDCVKLDARNLTFSVTLVKVESDQGQTLNSISVVLDTEFLGAVRFSRLQDILCFKAVWLDRIPIFNNQYVEPKTPLQAIANLPGDKSNVQQQNGFSTIILLRIRKIQLDVDLGQSITKIKLELHQSTFKTKLTDDFKEVLLHIGDVSILAQGNISGHANVSSCVFQTIRRSEDALRTSGDRSNMLELRLTSGSLSVALDSDHQQLLHYRAKPLEVEILDDWLKITQFDDQARPLQLSFSIKCPEIIAIVTVGTIPKLLSYMNKFKANLDSQRQGAARESQTFRITRTPKPDNPLSAVAEAMLHSARSRFKEAESDLFYVIKEHMYLQLDLLRLIVFPRSMRDMEIAQFIGQDVRARLSGLVGADAPTANRDLRLSFSSMVISKYTQVAHAAPMSLKLLEEQDGQDWLSALFKDATEAIIVGLPSMKMHMTSEEFVENSTRVLVYDFYSRFVRREGMKAFEDIYITLNMSLYSWLTILRKNLTREMEQVRATEDWRISIGAASNVINNAGPSQRKKKVPDALVLTDSPRSATLPSGGPNTFSPSSGRLGWVDHGKSPLAAREHIALSPFGQAVPSPLPLQLPSSKEISEESPASQDLLKRTNVAYRPRNRHIERLTMRQLGEATPDVMHPFFMKKAGFNLEDSLPQYVNEYAARPLDEIMEVLLKLYSQQLLAGMKKSLDND